MLFEKGHIMEFRLAADGDVAIVRLEGEIGAGATGRLYDVLVNEVRSGSGPILVEFAPEAAIARPAVRGLVVAAFLMRGARRAFAVTADAPLCAWLREIGFRHLLAVEPDPQAALARLSAGAHAAPKPTARADRRNPTRMPAARPSLPATGDPLPTGLYIPVDRPTYSRQSFR